MMDEKLIMAQAVARGRGYTVRYIEAAEHDKSFFEMTHPTKATRRLSAKELIRWAKNV